MLLVYVLLFLTSGHISEYSINVAAARKISPISIAINDIALKLYPGSFSNIRVLSSITKEMRQRNYEIVTDLIILLNGELKVTLEEPHTLEKSAKKRGSPMVIIIHSIESFELLEKKLTYDNLKFRKYYLLILMNGIFPGLENIMQRFWAHWIYNIGVLAEDDDGNVLMLTTFPFANGKCGNDLKLELINKFHTKTKSWDSREFFPERFNNLNLCPLKVGAMPSNYPSAIMKKTAKEGKVFSGIEVELIKAIASAFNSTTQFEDFDSAGSIYENGTVSSSGMLPSLFNKKVDAVLGTMSLQFERVLYLSETKTILSVPIVIVTPPAKNISPFEKLLRPFATIVWILLIVVFLIGIILILVTRRKFRKIYYFIVGEGVIMPVTNMLIAFFGLTQSKLPRMNFARYLLMNFLLFCLVLRCLYQGKLFIMLQMELRENEMETINDMMERNMIFYTYESMVKRVAGFKFASMLVIK